MKKNQDEATECTLYNQDGDAQCPLLNFMEENFQIERKEIIHSLGLPSNMPDGKNRKRSFPKAGLVYRICNIGRWITGGIVIFFIARLIWKQNRALNFIASQSGDNLFVTGIDLVSSYTAIFLFFVLLTVILSVITMIVKKKVCSAG